MDRMMPIDLERADLRKRLRGYDPKTVDALRLQAAAEMELLRKELSEANAELDRLRAEVCGTRAMEETLKQALILAQKTADETRAQAHREADSIIHDARRKAAEDLRELRMEADRLREDNAAFEASFRSTLESHLARLRKDPVELFAPLAHAA
jgi:cell division initiation protein